MDRFTAMLSGTFHLSFVPFLYTLLSLLLPMMPNSLNNSLIDISFIQLFIYLAKCKDIVPCLHQYQYPLPMQRHLKRVHSQIH